MNNKMEEIARKEIVSFGEKKISRKEAIRRTGYIAASAATMMVLLSNPAKAGGPETSAVHKEHHDDNGNGHGNSNGNGNGNGNSPIWK
ncbi:MAG: hypothetical protein WCI54_18295 [Bacteroidia bacterium]